MMDRQTLLIGALMLSSATTATDRVVSPSGTYNTISGAIAASSDGDRVLVTSGNYAENIAIAKSLSIVPLVEGTRYTVIGYAAVNMPAGGRLLLSGIRLKEGLNTGMPHTARTEVTIVDSYLYSCSLVDPFVRVELYRDSIYTGVTLSSGAVVGNYFRGDDSNGAFARVQGVSALPEEILMIGNSIGLPTGGGGIDLQTNSVFIVENNFVRSSPGLPAVRVYRTGNLTAVPSSVVNNTFYKHVNSNTSAVVNGASTYFALVVKNNALIGHGLGAVGDIGGWPQLVESHNQSVAVSAIVLSTGGPSPDSPLIDAGDPDPRYMDLDLTTNDVGCYGGSNSRANFTTAMGSAVVGFMQAPRVVSLGDPVNINAVGFDR